MYVYKPHFCIFLKNNKLHISYNKFYSASTKKLVKALLLIRVIKVYIIKYGAPIFRVAGRAKIVQGFYAHVAQASAFAGAFFVAVKKFCIKICAGFIFAGAKLDKR